MEDTTHTTHPTFADAVANVADARNRMNAAWNDYEDAGHVTDAARTATSPRCENFGSSRSEKFAWELATIAEEIAWIEYSLARLEFEIARDGVADAKKKNRDKTI